MGVSKNSAGHRSKRTTSPQARKFTTFQSLLHRTHSATKHRRHSWTKEQLSDPNFLKVPASIWKNIHDTSRTEWLDATENTLTLTLAAGTALSPTIGLVKAPKWFWDKSIETKSPRDTYRYRVIEQATDDTILPEDDWYDPVEDDDTKIKILYVGLPFEKHTILLLRRICPDVTLDAIQSVDEWRQFFAPSIRQGYSQVKQSTTYGWAPVAKRRKGRKT